MGREPELAGHMPAVVTAPPALASPDSPSAPPHEKGPPAAWPRRPHSSAPGAVPTDQSPPPRGPVACGPPTRLRCLRIWRGGAWAAMLALGSSCTHRRSVACSPAGHLPAARFLTGTGLRRGTEDRILTRWRFLLPRFVRCCTAPPGGGDGRGGGDASRSQGQCGLTEQAAGPELEMRFHAKRFWPF